MSPEGMGGLAGHSDLPPPPPGMTTHERLTQLLETEIQHGHLLQALPPTATPARWHDAYVLPGSSHTASHHRAHPASTRTPAHPHARAHAHLQTGC